MTTKIIDVSRGSIKLSDKDTEYRVLGEGLLPTNSISLGYVIYMNSLTKSDEMGNYFPIDDEVKKATLLMRSRIISCPIPPLLNSSSRF